MIVIIDNYDSFTYNLVQYLGEMEGDVRVYRNDAIDVAGIRALKPDHLVVSPGPCTPQEAGISIEVIRELGPEIPTLGVCLGHQSIGAAFGGEVVRADRVMHGKLSRIHHFGNVLYDGIESPFEATRYHSLIIRRETCPDELEIIAETDDKIIMGVAHRHYPIWGVQYHPESILTKPGKQMLRNFLNRKAG
ncbi:MAG TPA: aminodeoxychorismate/anthranilate synthase component II [Candidatus Hydrogenedentes bacterium]|jgi:para-aminobenzoate synthetase component 2|nr:aminodeoxychorismate/anthranilate synthase component II [Candidatus Hydrogenedentota bacterium]HQI76263.1 aminodeoxychorismate/anthranilate synthase component II [Candidatus Latescibacterota bacterium]NLT59299.1 aminodeoxychorismate/anthranilate synthase component II [Candidatus Hydrogenedentota bacterium]HNZ17387.1 aminodeoxychorismate/anthranilate synthase component II [Candidatus Hydrogenedentota bacterium]HOH33193.1 aminodeoxychorismate/anthranilate synthase component II [Candidatus Hydr